MWWIYAILSAFFASLTAIFAKMGVENYQFKFSYRHTDNCCISHALVHNPGKR